MACSLVCDYLFLEDSECHEYSAQNNDKLQSEGAAWYKLSCGAAFLAGNLEADKEEGHGHYHHKQTKQEFHAYQWVLCLQEIKT